MDSRDDGRGILIYWHVERGSMVVHSQTLRASASEVHAMVEGAIRHGTTTKVEGNHADTHGSYPQLAPALTRPIRWDLVEQNDDQMVKYATANRQGTASTEAIRRRFTAPHRTRPTRRCWKSGEHGARFCRPLPAQPRVAT